jgi:tetratricopeptide (TPR) repeat protein
MKEPSNAIHLLELAINFNIEFDSKPLEMYLKRRKIESTLSQMEQAAQLLLLIYKKDPDKILGFIKSEKRALSRIVPSEFLSQLQIESFVKAGQIADAEKELESSSQIMNKTEYARCELLIADGKGEDLKKLTTLFEKTGDYLDLRNLVDYLVRTKQWEALLPKAILLHKQHRSAKNALLIVDVMQKTNVERNRILVFLNENNDLCSICPIENSKLLSAKAWTLFDLGRYKEAQIIINDLVNNYHEPNYISMELNCALRTGQSERFAQVIEREYPKSGDLPEWLLLQMAFCLANRVDDRVIDLLKQATDRAKNDASIQESAYFLSTQIGRENEFLTCLKRMFQLSKEGKGSGKTYTTEEILEMMPKRNEELNIQEKRVMKGELPLHVSQHLLNIPLAQIMISSSKLNCDQIDSRKRTIIPIRHGGRTNEIPPKFNRLIQCCYLHERWMSFLKNIKMFVSTNHLKFKKPKECKN